MAQDNERISEKVVMIEALVTRLRSVLCRVRRRVYTAKFTEAERIEWWSKVTRKHIVLNRLRSYWSELGRYLGSVKKQGQKAIK